MLPNKLTDYFDKPAWINKILFYTTIFASIALAFIIVFGIFNLIFPNFTFPNDAIDYDNERYLLSALVQSLAATIALVITLSLVAVQLAAQSYSARVIEVYKKNPDMWILLCIYIITIFYGLGLTKIIGLGILGNYMEGAIFVAYFMGFFAFVCLVPYMLKTLDLLKPSTVIKLLAEEIKIKNLMISLDNPEKIAENDPVQPIIDVVNAAVERSDYETVKNGIKAITYSTTQIFENNDLEEREEDMISPYILEHIEKLGMKIIKKDDEILTRYLIEKLQILGGKALEGKLLLSTEKVIGTLNKIGAMAANQKLEGAAGDAIIALGKIGIRTAKQNNIWESADVLNAIENIGTISVEQRLEWPAGEAIIALGEIGTIAAKKNIEISFKDAAYIIGILGVKATEKKLEWSPNKAENVLNNLLKIVEKNGVGSASLIITDALENINQTRKKRN